MSDYRLSVRAIIVDDDKILLNEFNNGEYYNLPGGGLEAGETLRDCVKREVYEESGYTVRVGDLLYVYEYNPARDRRFYGDRGALSHVFLCEIDTDYLVVESSVIDSAADGSISTGCKWIGLSDLEHIPLLPQIGKQILSDLKEGTPVAKFLEDLHYQD